jgi:hypothetical protein
MTILRISKNFLELERREKKRKEKRKCTRINI